MLVAVLAGITAVIFILGNIAGRSDKITPSHTVNEKKDLRGESEKKSVTPIAITNESPWQKTTSSATGVDAEYIGSVTLSVISGYYGARYGDMDKRWIVRVSDTAVLPDGRRTQKEFSLQNPSQKLVQLAQSATLEKPVDILAIGIIYVLEGIPILKVAETDNGVTNNNR